MASWNRNAVTLLRQAEDSGVHVLALQETNLGPVAEPGALNLASRNGWQMVHLRQPDKRRGGVALLCRQPLGLTVVSTHKDATSQLLV